MQDEDKKVSLTPFCIVLLFHESLKPGESLPTRRSFGIARVIKHGRDSLGVVKSLSLEAFKNRLEKHLSGIVCVAERALGRKID